MKKVLVSFGYGAGFGTWNDNTFRKQLVEDEVLIGLVEKGLHLDPTKTKYARDNSGGASAAFVARCNQIAKSATGKDENYVCLFGVCDLKVCEVDGQYRIEEYDGFESIHTSTITKEQALERLKKLARSRDTEDAHASADNVLLALIDDPEIEAAYDAIDKWYA